MKKFLLIISIVLYFCFQNIAQNKVPINYKVYDTWKDIENAIISENGEWVSYEINPQKGDGWLFNYNIKSGKKDSIARGYAAKFSTSSDFLVYKIKAQEDTIRKAKIAKKKDDDLPKDSLGIWIFKNNKNIKFPQLKSFKIAKENSSHIAYFLDKNVLKKDSIISKDSTSIKDSTKLNTKPKKKKKENKKKSDTWLLNIYNPTTFKSYQYKDVSDYSVSNNGSVICFITLKKDSIADTCSVYYFNTTTEKYFLIYKNKGTAKKIFSDDSGEQISFIFSSDTAKQKSYNLYYWNKKNNQTKCIIDTMNTSIPKGWSVSENYENYFSKDGLKIFFSTNHKPEIEKKDTIPDDEKVKLDIWNWKDTLIQSQQIINIENEKKRSFLATYFIKENKTVQLASETMPHVTTLLKGNSNIGIGYSYKLYSKSISWITNQFKDVYSVDFNTGKRKIILQKKQSVANISPNGNFIIWYETNDSIWYIYSLKNEKLFPVTKGLNVNFYDEENDVPSVPDPYGLGGWIKDDKYVLIYDKYDIWKVASDGKEKPQNLTKGFGRKNNISLRYIELDKEALWINPEKQMLLSAFNYSTKQAGFYTTKINSNENIKELMVGDNKFSTPQKSKNSDKLIWRKSNFQIYPDLWVSDFFFKNSTQISDANPQQKKYAWGTVELLKWKGFDGHETEGLLYKPADFDKQKKYPMIVYYYEKNSDQLHQHYSPHPSRSVISFSEFASNGYVIFIPDIKYKTGSPGQDAYNAIINGTDYILSLGFVDENNMGLQGQSWGGYQTAFVITRTNRFKAAMAGAAVTNMTSAYGGIRWTSGVSRMMQYEDGQSRIGGTLWEKRDNFIENSPIFFADKVQTPLLLMNNDADGAVPWQQGIEFFLALRRLEKPVWLLNYNGDDHNLKKRPNCIDLSIRLSQFFNHFLKGDSIPEWMEKGIPAIKKNKENGYELIKK